MITIKNEAGCEFSAPAISISGKIKKADREHESRPAFVAYATLLQPAPFGLNGSDIVACNFILFVNAIGNYPTVRLANQFAPAASGLTRRCIEERFFFAS